ncbi:GTP-binding protein HflX [Oceanisphaera litoralis]|uniref:ribosome rescue GTPase HflX n=1 Tax=Oceanisphaera litoralis TaxID=225144 RepID=UPI00195953DD|nr:ribosome rescue GTPase HflX [Oceanisphaera litoralis]MBM7456716.1 GTP-binding protein HflX [Oceanisphaera litoralis]
MFERYQGGESAILVHVNFADDSEREDLEELELLTDSAGVTTCAVLTGSRGSPQPKFFIGTGKVDELAALVQMHRADVVIFNHSLSPAQERNLEREVKCRVLDRTGLILDIFAQRARTHEGKLQVELAQLRHLSTRLVRGWTHLERQKGGIGLRGPGETQLETDRRLLRERIKSIQKRLEKVSRQREQGRRARKRNELPTLSLVGYTNAGKSTLFNRMTQAGVYAADQLFATLDPTLRKVELPDAGPAILADTVGFIRHLPHDLIAAFKATLQETRDADLLLHVVDCADEQMRENIDEVNSVLEQIDADEVPVLMVFNKIDKLEQPSSRVELDEEGKPRAVWLSAQEAVGIEGLLDALNQLLSGVLVEHRLTLPAAASRLRSRLYAMNGVVTESFGEQGEFVVDIRLQQADWQRLLKQEGEQLARFISD